MSIDDPERPVAGRAQVPGPRPGAGEPFQQDSAVRPPVRSVAARASVPVSPPPASAAGRASVAMGAARVAGRDGEAPASGAGAKGRKKRRRNIVIASIAAFIMIAGIGLVAGTYYFDTVALPEDISMEQSTTIYYADGTTPLARIGDKNRTVITIDQIPDHVQKAVVAAEDNTFYTNDGVDYKGVLRAAWNNVTGGERQGASTISQQYARQWAELEGVTYARKLREAVIALKLNQQYEKPKILEMYLNIVYFGRGAYGIQAAAQAYFSKPAKDLTPAEGVVLAGLIKSPDGTGKGSPFDPTVDAKQAHERFDYIKGQMVKLNFVHAEEADKVLAYPEKVNTAAQTREQAATTTGSMDKPEGLIVHHVLGEVAALTDAKTGRLLYEGEDPDGKKNFDQIRNGGLKIVTTIDQRIQQIAVREASRNKESNMFDQPPNLQAALVAVEPGTGAVKAYYGGDNGNGGDYAGYYRDPVLGDGDPSCCGGHPPGSTFKVYTLATGLMNGYRTDSYWNGESPQEFPNSGRTFKTNNPVKNAGEGTSPDCKSGSGKWCTLEEVTVKSLNVPFFALSELVGRDKVIDTARAAGITEMWATVDGKSKRIDLTKVDGAAAAKDYFSNEVAFGQYPVTVLDHAGGIATFAARGAAAKTHFLKEVWTGGKKTYAEVIKPVRIPGFTVEMSDDLNAVLQGVPEHYNLTMSGKRKVAGKTGTWQLGQTTDNAHAWMVGYSAYDPGKKSVGLAAAVWVGNQKDEQKIVKKGGTPIIGGNLPGPIWRDFLDAALTAVKMPIVGFPPRRNTGDKELGTGISPQASAPPPVNPSTDPSQPGPSRSPDKPGPSKSPATSPSPKPSNSRRN
ncbi:transglycosylase domain-containing protein [Dactylosporangium sp. AC04546]|uniref:transglycosylase domain-containing protein n=1 Tax=Dactylosporangium sp. AC04546 TaxID=2862460 RepID=UPI001EE086EF|nr:transglycosylase domain-containing protein [Dactylosporangium sp. AC04546]WVK79934.1 transglycosylase domain-containing protein [Dactylosporangium sp. AC04546]